MTDRRGQWTLGLFAVVLMVGCPGTGPGSGPGPGPVTIPAGDGAWDVQSVRTVGYRLETRRSRNGAPAGDFDQRLQLDFRGGGQVSVSIDGVAKGQYAMADTGELTGSEPLPSSFDFLRTVPGRKAMVTGRTEEFLFPDDATRRASQDSVVYGSAIVATIEGTSPMVSIRLAGTAALLRNPGLDKFTATIIGDDPLPEVRELFDRAKAKTPYLEGQIEFDLTRGELASATAKVIELPFGDTGADTVKLQLTRQ